MHGVTMKFCEALLSRNKYSQLSWCRGETIGWRIEESSFHFRSEQRFFSSANGPDRI